MVKRRHKTILKADRYSAGSGYAAEGAVKTPLTLEDENTKLRKLVADLALDREMLQDVIRRPEGQRQQKL